MLKNNKMCPLVYFSDKFAMVISYFHRFTCGKYKGREDRVFYSFCSLMYNTPSPQEAVVVLVE